MQPMQLKIKDTATAFPIGSIISTQTGNTVTFETLMADLASVQVTYVGESHTNAHHHDIQLKILTALYHQSPAIAVGMEMFDHTYQPQLDQWSAGKLDEAAFLKTVHWYANWRYNYGLYRDILEFIQEKKLALWGLNLPFHIPPKISIGGTDSLSDAEKQHLPESIDLTNTGHREYLQGIFSHHQIPGRDDFENFYAAQCVWEDTMAEAVSRHLSNGKMIVLVGKGHIAYKFGIPVRAFSRTKANYRTIYLSETGGSIDQAVADYIWVTEPGKNLKHPI